MGEISRLSKSVALLTTKMENLTKSFSKLESDYKEFKRLALEIKPDGFSSDDFLGFSLEDLKKLAREKGSSFQCSYECGGCVKGQRMTCWETLTGEVAYDEEAGQETEGEASAKKAGNFVSGGKLSR